MAITFDDLSPDTRVPGAYTEVDNSAAAGGNVAFKILAMGPLLPAGTASEGEVKKVTSKTAANGFFGRRSVLAGICRALIDAYPTADIEAVGLDDEGAATAAAGTMTFTGTATEDGSIPLIVAGRRVDVAIASGDDQDACATKVVAALAETRYGDIPATFAVDGVNLNEVDGTAANKGTLGDNIDMRLDPDKEIVAGITVAFSGFTGGATDPDVTEVVTAIGSTRYDVTVTPWSDDTNLDVLEGELADRWDTPEENYGHVFSANVDTYSNQLTYGDARNSPHSTVLALPSIPHPPWEIAGYLAGVCAKSLETHPARPLRGLVLRGFLPPTAGDRFIWTERNQLLKDGMSTFLVNDAGEMVTERIITTYQTNSLGSPDTSFLQVETLFILMLMRDELRNMSQTKYPQYMLADNGTQFDPGVPVVTPNVMAGEYVALGREWVTRGLMENLEQFKSQLISERNGGDANRLDGLLRPDLINQFFVHAMKIQFLK